jgi:hypothetical protein
MPPGESGGRERRAHDQPSASTCGNIGVVTSPQLKSAEPESPLVCGGCGHNLFGASGRCPECGQAFDPNRLIGELIPWEQRKHAGYVRTYLRTAYLATFRPREIARKVESPVSYRSARLFRRITSLVAFLPLLVTALVVQYQVAKSDPTEEWRQLILSTWSFRVGLLGLLLGVIAANHVSGWLFYRTTLPRQRRGRAYAIGCYASAPLALFTIPVAIWVIAIALYTPAPGHPETTAFTFWRMFVAPFVVFPLSVILVGAAVYSTMVMHRVATGAGFVRLAISAALLPVGWTISLAAGPIVIEFLLAFAVLLVQSFS